MVAHGRPPPAGTRSVREARSHTQAAAEAEVAHLVLRHGQTPGASAASGSSQQKERKGSSRTPPEAVGIAHREVGRVKARVPADTLDDGVSRTQRRLLASPGLGLAFSAAAAPAPGWAGRQRAERQRPSRKRWQAGGAAGSATETPRGQLLLRPPP